MIAPMLQAVAPLGVLFGFFCSGLLAQAPTGAALDQRRSEYGKVAKHVVPGLVGGASAEESVVEPAVIEAKERWRVIALDNSESGDRRLKAVAKEAGEAHARLLDAVNAGGDAGLFRVVAAIFTGNPMLVAGAALREVGHESGRASVYEAAIRRRRACMFMLPELAKELAGPAASEPPIEINFDESWFVSGQPDRINLKNASGQELTNATLQVDIRGRDGRWVRNIHFVEKWAHGQALWANYLGIDPSRIESLAGVTAQEVQDVRVSVWAAEVRSEEVALHYPKADRDEDRWAILDKNVVVELDYVAQPIFEMGPCIGVRLRGVQGLPECKVGLVCQGAGEERVSLAMVVGTLTDGGRISIQSQGALKAKPKSVTVTIEVNGVPKAIVRTASITSSR